LSHGLASITAFMKTLTPPILFAIGPNTEGIESWPSSELTAPQYGTRPYDGLKPCKPQNAEGPRIELLGRRQRGTGRHVQITSIPADIRTNSQGATFKGNQCTLSSR
jgi:hypothetical protein